MIWESETTGDVYIKRGTWLSHGINPAWTLEEARDWAKRENAKSELKRHNERRVKILQKLDNERVSQFAYFSETELVEFETQKLFRHRSSPANSKKGSYWTVVRRMLVLLQIEPKDFVDQSARIYNYFAEKQYGTAYVQKLLRVLNLWGQFYCKRRGQFYEKVEAPVGEDRNAIKLANRRKKKRPGNRISEPLSFDTLTAKRDRLRPEHYNWLYVSCAFGLRPKEASTLHGEFPCKFDVKKGVTRLAVYQSKLMGEDDPWKRIPVLTPEQKRAKMIIESETPLTQPSNKILRSVFGPGFTGYCARNNFIPMMFDLGKTMEDVSLWLGHKSLERTYEYFRKLKQS